MTQARISSPWIAIFFQRGPRRPALRVDGRYFAACATAGAGRRWPLIRTLL